MVGNSVIYHFEFSGTDVLYGFHIQRRYIIFGRKRLSVTVGV